MEGNKKLKVQYTETTKQVNTKETLEMYQTSVLSSLNKINVNKN